jgi:hypothetical protein
MNYDKRSTHIDPSRGRVQFNLKCLNVGAIHRDNNKPTTVVFGFDKIRVLGKGFGYQRGSPRKTFRLRLSRVTTNRSSASKTESMRSGAWWSGLGGLSQFRALWILNRIRAWNHFARRSLLGAWSFCQVG